MSQNGYVRVLPLSVSDSGKGILISSEKSPGDVIHETGFSIGECDEIDLYAVNNSSWSAWLTIVVGDNTLANRMQYNLPSLSGLITLFSGLVIASDRIVIRAYADISNQISVYGKVIRRGESY